MPDDWSVVHAWHAAVNARDAAAARALVTDDVVLGGPKGEAAGAELFATWVREAGIHLLPVAWHPVGPNVVVVAQDATWPWRADADPDAPAAPLRVASLFRLVGSGTGMRIAAILRYDTLADALEAAMRQGELG